MLRVKIGVSMKKLSIKNVSSFRVLFFGVFYFWIWVVYEVDRAKGWGKPSPLFFLSPSRFPLRTQALQLPRFSGRPPAAVRPPTAAAPVPFGRPPTQQPPWTGERSPSSAVRERCRPRRPTAQTFFSPELPPPATNPGKLGTVL